TVLWNGVINAPMMIQVSSQGVQDLEKPSEYALTSRMPRLAPAPFVSPFFPSFLGLLAFSDETAALQGGGSRNRHPEQGGGPVTAALLRAAVLCA
ncbi:hypothetical protein KI387_005521, partial [Taxus chinensis]